MLNQFTINIAGQDRFMRPDFESLINIENALGKGLLRIVTEANEISVGDMVDIIYFGLKSGSGELRRETIGKEVIEKGFLTFSEPVGDFLRAALSGPKKSEEQPSE